MKESKRSATVENTSLTRRTAIKQAAVAAGIAWGGPMVPFDALASDRPTAKAIERVKGIARRDDTIARIDIVGSVYGTTWAADDRQYVSVVDGIDLAEPATETYHSRMFTLRGEPPNAALEALPGYPHMPMRMRESEYASFWGGHCLAVDGIIYQLLSTTNHPYLKPDGKFWPGFRGLGSKLIYSPDHGVTWRNQDGTHPVVWENWNARSRSNMLFYDEEIIGGSFLQMGKDYGANQDGYVYVYSCNPELASEQLDLARVAKSKVRDRNSYEFFSGMLANGNAAWTRDIKKRTAMHAFPEGWVSRSDQDGMVPLGWSVDVVYNEPLGLYMMAAQGMGVSSSGVWFGKPSYLGFWVAPAPWGPFRQIHQETAWTPANDQAARAHGPRIAPKWIAPDGKSFWLSWADYAYKGSAGEVENPDKEVIQTLKGITDDREFAQAFKAWTRRHQPNAYLNMQRVELIVE